MEYENSSIWTTVTIPRANLYKWREHTNSIQGNLTHYKEVCEWCNKYFPEDGWDGHVDMYGVKYFTFKDSRHATLFRLRWGSLS